MIKVGSETLAWDAACFRDIANKLKDLIKSIREEQEDMLHNLDTFLSFGVEFDEVRSFDQM